MQLKHITVPALGAVAILGTLLAPVSTAADTPPRSGGASTPGTVSAAVAVSDCTELDKRLPALAKAAQDGALAACDAPAGEKEAAAQLRTPAAKELLAAGPCATAPNKGWKFTGRGRACNPESRLINVRNVRTRQLVGQLYYLSVGMIVAKNDSLTWDQTVSMRKTGGWGRISGTSVYGVGRCASADKCTTLFTNFPMQLMGEGRTNEGQWKMRSTIDKQDRERGKGQNRATAVFINPGWVGVAQHDLTSASVRCDSIRNMGRGGMGAGCVLPEYWPTMTEMKQFPYISQGIRKVQRVGPHHYGRKTGANPNPLVYTSNAAIRKNNNDAACPSSRPRPPGQTCDEYPFASTLQGASRTQWPDWGWRWVPKNENDRQGYQIRTFYDNNRILNGDRFWVDAG